MTSLGASNSTRRLGPSHVVFDITAADNTRIREVNAVTINDPAVLEVLAEYRKRAADEDTVRGRLSREEWLSRRDDFLLEVGESVATLLNLLIRETGAKTILEAGTSYGYSTAWMAEAARATRGKIITLDLR